MPGRALGRKTAIVRWFRPFWRREMIVPRCRAIPLNATRFAPASWLQNSAAAGPESFRHPPKQRLQEILAETPRRRWQTILRPPPANLRSRDGAGFAAKERTPPRSTLYELR